MLRYVLFFVALCASADTSVIAGVVPTYDPVAAVFPGQSGSWGSYNWSNVFDVDDYDKDFTKAQDAAVKAGGGVVYFPAGTYKFTKNIELASNVVIRGASTNDTALVGSSPGKLAPKTVFECPDMQHMGIFSNDPKASFQGVVNVDLDGCAVMLWPMLEPAPVSFKNYWYAATKVTGAGENKIVFGCRSRNVVLGNPDPSMDLQGKTNITASNPWPWRFSTAIAVYTSQGTLVANNLIAKASRSAKTSAAGFSNIPFPYDNRYGIDVNQILYGGVLGKTSGGPCKATPSNSPYYFSKDIHIIGNYVYMNGRVGVSWSGGGDGKTPGSGAQIIGNHVEVAKGTTFYSEDGKKPATGHDTNENRGFNQQGFANNVTGNTGHINRQKTPDHYETVDGEGILHQCSSGNDGLRNVWHNNDLRGGETGYMLFYKLTHVEDNSITDNKVNSDQHIGTIDNSGDVVKNNKCSGNSPKCTGF